MIAIYDKLRRRHSVRTLLLALLMVVFTTLISILATNQRPFITYHYNNISTYSNNVTMYLTYSYRIWADSDNADTRIIRPSEQVWATIDGMTADGRAVIRLWGITIGNEKQIVAEFAALKLVNVSQAAKLVNQYKRQQVLLDYYVYEQNGERRDCIVVWLDESPINAMLIQIGAAQPDENPKTNITNRLMQAYYKGRI